MDLKAKLENARINGLQKNNFFVYNICIEKDEEGRNHFIVRSLFLWSPLGFIPLSKVIIYNCTSNTYQKKIIHFNIWLAIFFGLFCLFIWVSSLGNQMSDIKSDSYLVITSLALSFIFIFLVPAKILKYYLRSILREAQENKNYS